MIKVDGLSVWYGDAQVLHRISFTLSPGRPLVIVGESGAGKTSLALSLMRLSRGQSEGRVTVDGEDLLAFDEKRLRRYRGRQAALVVQAVGDALNPHLRVVEQIADAMISHGTVSRGEARRRAEDLLRRQGLARDVGERFPAGLSGGEIQRVLLAMALANDPGLLILDEPTAALDPDARRHCLDIIKGEARRRCTLLITHDFEAAREIGADAAVLYGGHLFERGPASVVLTAPRHPYSRGLLRAVPDRLSGKDLQGIPGSFERQGQGCPFANRCAQGIGLCRESAPELAETSGHGIACHRGGIVPALTVRGLSKSMGARPVLRGVDLTLAAGETVAIFGASGSGKSTLARVLAGLDVMDAGVIEQDRETGGRLALVPQHPQTAVAPHFTIAEAVAEPLIFQGIDTDERSARVRDCLGAVQLPSDDAFLARKTHSLSGGELQRVVIARALVQNPAVLVADEATSALDVSVQAKVVRLLMDLQERRGLALLFITHDHVLAKRVADRIMVLEHGKLRSASDTGTVP